MSTSKHWTVAKWGCARVAQGHNFKIEVDRDFIQAASYAGLDEAKAQEVAVHFASEAGYRVAPGVALLRFGDCGIEEFRVPIGEEAWLRLEKSSLSKEGGTYSTQNVDHSGQQAFLMCLWVWWAAYVETRIRK